MLYIKSSVMIWDRYLGHLWTHFQKCSCWFCVLFFFLISGGGRIYVCPNACVSHSGIPRTGAIKGSLRKAPGRSECGFACSPTAFQMNAFLSHAISSSQSSININRRVTGAVDRTIGLPRVLVNGVSLRCHLHGWLDVICEKYSPPDLLRSKIGVRWFYSRVNLAWAIFTPPAKPSHARTTPFTQNKPNRINNNNNNNNNKK